MISIAQNLQAAWLHRWNQRIEPALQGLAEVQGQAGWVDLVTDALPSVTEREEFVEALLLKASLLRAQGFRQKSSAMLAKIKSQSDAASLPRGFRLLFELGLDHWIDQDLAQALEYFLLAERKARNEVEKVFAASNVLWCLEALDLDRKEAEEKVARILREAEDPGAMKHVAEMLDAYLLRKNFYQRMEIAGDAREGLPGFFSQWARSLPYMESTSGLMLSQEYLWQGSYRLRTLARIWIPADQHSTRLSDAIDRLYLWVWLAMAGNPEMTKEKTLYTLESVLRDFDFENQSKENLLLFRNALGWMLVLYPSIKSRVHGIYERLARLSSHNYALLEAEFDLMLSLSQERAVSSPALFETFPPFAKIYRDMRSSLPFLQEKLTPILAKARNFDLIVDKAREEILLPGQCKLMASKGLTKLLSALAEQDEVPMSAIDSFEPFNLIYRARKLLGPGTILMQRKVLRRGPKWPKTLVLSDVDLPDYQVAAMKPSLPESDAHLQAARALLPNAFRRVELEKRLAVSKATANRMIENWVNEGRLSARGRAKATEYFWKEEKL